MRQHDPEKYLGENLHRFSQAHVSVFYAGSQFTIAKLQVNTAHDWKFLDQVLLFNA